MKGTIDQVETFFVGVTGIWQRVLTFFGVCWLAFALSLVVGALHRSSGGAWDFYVTSEDWYLVPLAWMVSLLEGSMASWWGLVYLLFLAATMFAVTILEVNLMRASLLLFAFQSWHTLTLFYSESLFLYSYDGFEFRPLGMLLLVSTVPMIGWLCRSTWREHKGT